MDLYVVTAKESDRCPCPYVITEGESGGQSDGYPLGGQGQGQQEGEEATDEVHDRITKNLQFDVFKGDQPT